MLPKEIISFEKPTLMVFPSRIQYGFCLCMCKEEGNNRGRKIVR